MNTFFIFLYAKFLGGNSQDNLCNNLSAEGARDNLSAVSTMGPVYYLPVFKEDMNI